MIKLKRKIKRKCKQLYSEQNAEESCLQKIKKVVNDTFWFIHNLLIL